MPRSHVVRGLLQNTRRIAAALVAFAPQLLVACCCTANSPVAAAAVPAFERVLIPPQGGKSQVPDATARGTGWRCKRSVHRTSARTERSSRSARWPSATMRTCGSSHPTATVIAKRHFPPWAPMQVATLAGGQAMAVGLAYSRVTSPDPTVWMGPAETLMHETLKDEFRGGGSVRRTTCAAASGRGRLAHGMVGQLLGRAVRARTGLGVQAAVAIPRRRGKRQQLRYEDKNQLPTNRAMRMAASPDGKRVAFGWLGFSREVVGSPRTATPSACGRSSRTRDSGRRRRWPERRRTPRPGGGFSRIRTWRRSFAWRRRCSCRAMWLRPWRSTAMARAWRWWNTASGVGCETNRRSESGTRRFSVLNFLPKQRGRLRVFDGEGREMYRESLPAEGMFEVGFGSDSNEVWCWPAAWFARGMAGAAWLPVDSPARTVYRIGIEDKSAVAIDFPDAVADLRAVADERTSAGLVLGRAHLSGGPRRAR